MTADTPRVTVPVEPTEAMLDATAHFFKASGISQHVCRDIYRAMLAAAPAPEGWAVQYHVQSEGAPGIVEPDPALATREEAPALENPDDPSAPENARDWPSEEAPACKTCGGKGYTEHEGGEGEGYPSRPEIEACACREEAPAEAGEWITGDQLHEIMQSFTDRADVSEIAAKINAAIALRAQPQAREDAQPVLTVWYGSMPESNGRENWTATIRRVNPTDKWDQGFCFARSEYPERVRYEADRMRWIIGELAEKPDILAYDEKKHSGYVAPHPAPDALRDAVEALERIATVDMGGGFLGALACRQVATKALAALQAEQKGGAA